MDTRYIDFVYIRHGLRIAIEIDAFSTHYRDLDQWKYDDHIERQNHLVIDDWRVLRFTLNRIKEYPRQCQRKLQQALGDVGV